MDGMNPSQAAEQFRITGRLIYANVIGRGNVNDTYEVAFRAGTKVERVVLQRINRHVFSRPEWIMENMRLVTDHLERKIQKEYMYSDREWGYPQVVRTRDGKDFFVYLGSRSAFHTFP